MIFPSDSEIRDYATYYIRALSIFKEEFKNNQGRPPTEFEVQDFSKMGIIPYGILKQQNGFQKPTQEQTQGITNTPKNEQKPASTESKGSLTGERSEDSSINRKSTITYTSPSIQIQ